MPVAVNCSAVPSAIEGFTGRTVMDMSTTVTVRTVEPEIIPDLAVTVVVPAAFVVTVPFDLPALIIVATDLDEELQFTNFVMSFVLLSE